MPVGQGPGAAPGDDPRHGRLLQHTFGEVFPDAAGDARRGGVDRCPAPTAQKMSKTYGNTIEIFAEGKPLKKSGDGHRHGHDAAGRPEGPGDVQRRSQLYKLFATPAERRPTWPPATGPADIGYGRREEDAAGEDRRLLRPVPRRSASSSRPTGGMWTTYCGTGRRGHGRRPRRRWTWCDRRRDCGEAAYNPHMVRFDPTELRKYGGLTLLARQVVEGFLTGVHQSPYKGFSVEFAEHRQYGPGDEIRHIDWRAVRQDRPLLRQGVRGGDEPQGLPGRRFVRQHGVRGSKKALASSSTPSTSRRRWRT